MKLTGIVIEHLHSLRLNILQGEDLTVQHDCTSAYRNDDTKPVHVTHAGVTGSCHYFSMPSIKELLCSSIGFKIYPQINVQSMSITQSKVSTGMASFSKFCKVTLLLVDVIVWMTGNLIKKIKTKINN